MNEVTKIFVNKEKDEKGELKMTTDSTTVQRVITDYLHHREGIYEAQQQLYPEQRVRNFFELDESAMCCDGLLKRIEEVRIRGMNNNIRYYDLIELKGKSFDKRHRDIGQNQMNATMGYFTTHMKPYCGISFIKPGPWLQKRGYEVKSHRLYRLRSNKPERLQNNVPLYVYMHRNNKIINP